MSRVHGKNKFMNTPHYDSSVTGPSKMVRVHFDGEDYHKASNLSAWLFMKYDMSYKTYRKKSRARRAELKEEYAEDTGNDITEGGGKYVIDKKNPEIQKYLEEELQKQREQIVERIIWKNKDMSFYGPTYEEVEYYTRVSREKIDKIADKCRWKVHYRDSWTKGILLSSVKLFRNFMRYEESTPNTMDKEKEIYDVTKTFSDEPSALEWRKNPNEYAVMELVKHGIENEDIMDNLELTYDQLQDLYPTDEELEAYHPIFDEKSPSDEELEERYQEMLRERFIC